MSTFSYGCLSTCSLWSHVRPTTKVLIKIIKTFPSTWTKMKKNLKYRCFFHKLKVNIKQTFSAEICRWKMYAVKLQNYLLASKWHMNVGFTIKTSKPIRIWQYREYLENYRFLAIFGNHNSSSIKCRKLKFVPVDSSH